MADAGTETGEQGKKTETPAGGSDAGKGAKDFQPVIDAIIARERKEAAAAVSAKDTEIARLSAELEKATKGKKSGEGSTPEVPAEYVESIRKPLVEKATALEERLTARDNTAKRSEIKRIAAELAVDGAVDDVADALLSRVKILDTGTFEVVDKDGRAEYGANGPKSLNELVLDLLKSKPYLAKATVRNGAGFGQAPRNTSGGEADVAEIKRQIAEHEGKHEFAKAAPLKQKLIELARKK